MVSNHSFKKASYRGKIKNLLAMHGYHPSTILICSLKAWRQKLKSLVQSCYDYNGCSYLLHFSSKLQQLKGGFKYADNWDGTMSMYDSTSGKLLVTFRNENMVAMIFLLIIILYLCFKLFSLYYRTMIELSDNRTAAPCGQCCCHPG